MALYGKLFQGSAGGFRARRAAGRLAAVLLAALFAFGAAPLSAQQKKAFYDVVELRRLLEVARESGFSEQELREITIEDNGDFIKAARKAGFSEKELTTMTAAGDETRLNIWGYLQVLEARKKLADDRLKAQRSKVYLTVQDLFAEMRKKNQDDLTELRDKLPDR